MEDRAKKLAGLLKDGKLILAWREESHTVIANNTAKEIADLLAPPEYPCNGEIVEFVLDDGDKSIGYATERGVSIWHSGYANISWSRIKDYRIIREAKEFVPHPDDWHIGACEVLFEPSYYYTGGQLVTAGVVKELTRAEAEEIHRKLK